LKLETAARRACEDATEHRQPLGQESRFDVNRTPLRVGFAISIQHTRDARLEGAIRRLGKLARAQIAR
jgi:hypothetical protein